MTVPLPFSSAAPQQYYYPSKLTNNTYILDTTNKAFAQAEGWCAEQGGHLVSYDNLAEQQEVSGLGRRPIMLLCMCSWCHARPNA